MTSALGNLSAMSVANVSGWLSARKVSFSYLLPKCQFRFLPSSQRAARLVRDSDLLTQI